MFEKLRGFWELLKTIWNDRKFYWKHKRVLWKHRNTRFHNILVKGQFRNLACPCGSKKKTKFCHGVKSTLTAKEFLKLGELIRSL